ncbi:MAG: hypothetical protein QF486_04015 [Candidatus Woesearchaeota archaeon]|jgi:hypothetical protein|nr:hypothetical protein [Candidatus Woesearchaeota archaeon]MDP7181672.1 hypothetical protein [Candidatus Woesearchaeota archaeon]MDP7198761.1 hypothetical protein [Candidatus Woesearchaeota archaeon]MDP7467239.1 hypothetical protein [Candidatus Woesearchaeota archaeon]MDP7647426.1 hypothetical protein [Candidatus Woesearchaeota archaeon]
MAERDFIIDGARVEFTGPFDLKGLSGLFREFGSDKHYLIIEKRHIEKKTPEGQFHDYIISFTKKITDYARSEVDVRIQIKDAKENVLKVGSKKKKILNGHISFIVDGVLATDYEARWESKPAFFFIKTLFDKFVFVPYMSGWKAQVDEETTHLIENVKSFLNMQRF